MADALERLGPALAAAFEWAPEAPPDSAWLSHGAFAQWLVRALKPRRIVELGVHHGFSFFAFLDALDRAGLKGEAEVLGVDTWVGDPHAGYYGEEVFQDVATRAAAYGSMARLARTTFDEAAGDHPDAMADIIHIDGAHDEASVRADVARWTPKLKETGVLLLHDVVNRSDGFGVHKVWAALAEESGSRAFLLPHGSGLGLLAPNRAPGALEPLFAADADARAAVAGVFARLGAYARLKRREAELARYGDALRTSENARADLDRELSRAHGAIRGHEEARGALEADAARYADARADLDRYAEALKTSETARADLDRDLAEAHRAIKDYATRLADHELLEARFLERAHETAAAHAETARVERRRVSETEALRAEIARLMTRADAQRDRADRLEDRVKAQREELAAMRARLERLTGSVSWRAGKPIRLLGRILRRITGRDRAVRRSPASR